MSSPADNTFPDSLKTPVLILGAGLAQSLSSRGLKSVQEFTKKSNALKKLGEALGSASQAVVILQREEWFENSNAMRSQVTRIARLYPDCKILVVKHDPIEDEVLIRNDMKAGASAVLCYSDSRPSSHDLDRVMTFVTTGKLPRKQVSDTGTVEVPTRSTTSRADTGPKPGFIPPTTLPTGKTPSNQELLLHIVAQNNAILQRLNQLHGLAAGELLAQIKELYPGILEILKYPET